MAKQVEPPDNSPEGLRKDMDDLYKLYEEQVERYDHLKEGIRLLALIVSGFGIMMLMLQSLQSYKVIIPPRSTSSDVLIFCPR